MYTGSYPLVSNSISINPYLPSTYTVVNSDILLICIQIKGDNYERQRPDYIPQTVDKVVNMLLENHTTSSGNYFRNVCYTILLHFFDNNTY